MIYFIISFLNLYLGLLIFKRDVIESSSKLSIEEIIKIKKILKDSETLSEYEQQILNDETLQELQLILENYVNNLNGEIAEIKSLSDLVNFNNLSVLPKITYFITVIGAGIITIRRKKDDEK